MPRRRHTLVPALVTVALLAAPALAHADVPLAVPPAFLGGPIAPALAVAPPAANSTPDGAPLSVADPAPAEAAFVGYPCDPDDPPDCVEWTEPADLRNPPDAATAPAPGDARVAPAAPEVSDPAVVAATAGGLIAPAAEAWLPWQTPLLRWSPSRGATHYNVQIFRGTRLVLSAWPRVSHLRVPRGVLDQGRTYVWVVWPGSGSAKAPRYAGAPIGRATFEVTLRPRIVFRTPGTAPGTTVAEVRPHIPFGRVRLEGGPARVPSEIALDAEGRAVIHAPRRVAERLRATLVDRGPQPPLGLRAPAGH